MATRKEVTRLKGNLLLARMAYKVASKVLICACNKQKCKHFYRERLAQGGVFHTALSCVRIGTCCKVRTLSV